MAKEDKKERQLEYKRAKEDKRLENLAKFLYDLSKMTLAATVLALIPAWLENDFEFEWKYAACVLIGLSITGFLAACANITLKK